MATSSYVGIDVSKDKLDVAVLGEERVGLVDNTECVNSLRHLLSEFKL